MFYSSLVERDVLRSMPDRLLGQREVKESACCTCLPTPLVPVYLDQVVDLGLTSNGVYGEVSSGEMIVISNFWSFSFWDRVYPAHPVPTITIEVFDIPSSDVFRFPFWEDMIWGSEREALQ